MAVTKLRLALLKCGAPQYMIAARAGMPPSRVSEYALGHKPIPTHHLLALARVLQRNPADLVGEADVMESVVSDL